MITPLLRCRLCSSQPLNFYGLTFCAGNMGLKCAKQPKKLAVLILFTLLLLCYGVGNVSAAVHENSVDLQALLEFKQGISSDPKGALSSWNTNTHFCRWNGVNCSVTRRPLRVTELNFMGQGLTGQISSSLGSLTFLEKLDLSNNNFRGPVPLLRNMQQLKLFYLNNNFLDGIIPADAFTNCSQLSFIDLSTNYLAGSVPPNIGFLPSLMYLYLHVNNLTGPIPPTLGNATSLVELSLSTNRLEGYIPDELGHLTNLSSLMLNENFLSGGIPQALLSLSSLQFLDLGTNTLSNVLPPNIGNALPNLIDLIMPSNTFGGRIPSSIGNISSLERLDLSSNNFIGEIPSSFGNLLKLNYLFLSDNKLEAKDSQGWEFLNALGNCNYLQKLSMQKNLLQGVIPNSIGNLSINTLQVISLSFNNLSGIIPPSIGNYSGLTKLALNQNYFSGAIGEWIGNLKKLQGLYLNGNNFTGPVPSSFGNLLQLTELQLHKNELEGPIPPSLGNLTLLSLLRLNNNNFQGHIPPSLGNLKQLRQLNLAYNKLQGNIPLQVSNLQQLTILYLSSNKLTDRIPDTLGQCQSLKDVRMDSNFLTGEIPLSFGNLINLEMLNLSQNNMSGTIPTALSYLPLLTLDLSYNDFYGDIPRNGVFANATAVLLNGNKGLCGGGMNLHMLSCPTASRKTEKQYYLIRVLIPIFGFMSLILLVYFVLLVKKMPRKTYFAHPSFGENFPKVSYQDLAQATRNFSESNIVGRGSCGSVYSGKLKEPEMDVAVKVFNLEMRDAERSFMSECEALRSVQHRNLLPIITACSTVDSQGNVFKALIYEFMPNGNLDTWLHHKEEGKTPKFLGLTQRISIAVNIADALDYLHHDCGRPTVHCDLKPSNILLDDDMNALLGDFGIARFYLDSLSTAAGSVTSVGVRGTIGYIAPGKYFNPCISDLPDTRKSIAINCSYAFVWYAFCKLTTYM